jgi:hypothetical protein
VIIGIDPGKQGGIAYLSELTVKVIDMPMLTVKGKQIYAPNLIVEALDKKDVELVVVEEQHAFPKLGSKTSFSTGMGYGLLRGILAALRHKTEIVSSVAWKKAMFLTSDKDNSRVKAMELFPALTDDLARVKDDGRAEAVLLAEYGRRLYSKDTK